MSYPKYGHIVVTRQSHREMLELDLLSNYLLLKGWSKKEVKAYHKTETIKMNLRMDRDPELNRKAAWMQCDRDEIEDFIKPLMFITPIIPTPEQEPRTPTGIAPKL